jgi:hypothetical protein
MAVDIIGEDYQRAGEIKRQSKLSSSIFWLIRILPMQMTTLPSPISPMDRRNSPGNMLKKHWPSGLPPSAGIVMVRYRAEARQDSPQRTANARTSERKVIP